MTHTIWVFLPKNTTSHIQPLDQGIIAAMKARYRSRQVQWVISEAERDPPTPNAQQVDLRLAIIWLSDSFKEVCAETIRNCWAHACILPVEDELSIRQVKTTGSRQGRKKKLEELQKVIAHQGDNAAIDELASLLQTMNVNQSVNGVLSDVLPVHETVNAEGEDEVEEEMDLPGLVSLAKAVVRQETEPEEEDDAQDEEEEVIPVPLKKAQAAAKDIQTFVLDNLTQFAHVEEVQAAANMLAQSLNKPSQ